MTYSGDPASYIPSHERSITAGEQWLIDRTADEFLETGEWPKLGKLKRDAARAEIELPPIIHGTPLHDYLWRPDLDDTVILSIPGFARSAAGQKLVADFLQVVLLCRDLYLAEDDEPPRLLSADLRTKLGFDDTTIARIGKIFPFEYFLNAGGGVTSPTEWHYFVNETIVRFRRVATVAEYFSVRTEIVRPRQPTAPWPPAELSATSTPTVSGQRMEHRATDSAGHISTSSTSFDFFISHASEDKDDVARPLYDELVQRGYRVWFDEAELRLGDSLTRGIDAGLRNCGHGIVILSQSFFQKRWPEYELQGLVQKAMSGGRKVILPVWHGVGPEDVRRYSLSLADWVAVRSDIGIARVADEIEGGIGVTPTPPRLSSISVPMNSDQQRDLIKRKPPFWEYQLYAGALLQRREALEPKWHDNQIGYIDQAGPALPDHEAMESIQALIREWKRLSDNTGRLFEPSVMEAAFGPPGTPGDAGRILHLAERLMNLYEGFLDSGSNARSLRTSQPLQRLLSVAARVPTRPCEEIRGYVDKFVETVERIPSLVGNDDEKATVEITLTLTTDDSVMADLFEELRALEQATSAHDDNELVLTPSIAEALQKLWESGTAFLNDFEHALAHHEEISGSYTNEQQLQEWTFVESSMARLRGWLAQAHEAIRFDLGDRQALSFRSHATISTKRSMPEVIHGYEEQDLWRDVAGCVQWLAERVERLDS